MRSAEPGNPSRQAFDALGPRPERRAAFSPQLLAETHDAELDRLVIETAEALNTPIALVSLVLDQVQYFKAHHGLPADLAASRTTARDVSFCQFVVRDGEAFEVTDAAADDRVPQFVVEEYGIQAYLGFPLRVGEVVVGSLCVLDTKARSFTAQERTALHALADQVGARVTQLAADRRGARLELSADVSSGAIAQLRAAFEPLLDNLGEALPALAALRGALHHYEHVLLDGGQTSEQICRSTLTSAQAAFASLEFALVQLDANSVGTADTLLALELLTSQSPVAPFTDIVLAAEDLARPVTQTVGGARVPVLPKGVEIAGPRAMAVALVSATLSRVAQQASQRGVNSGLELHCKVGEEFVELGISYQGLSPADCAGVLESIQTQLGRDPTFSLRNDDDTLVVRFPIAQTS